jgi:hypothetical protein
MTTQGRTLKAQLVTALLESTMQDNVKWNTTVNSDTFETSFPEYTAQITATERYDDSEMVTDYIMRIYNNEGALVDEFSDVEVAQENSGFTAYQLMKDLYQRARRSSLGSDKAIKDILHYLGVVLEEDIPF